MNKEELLFHLYKMAEALSINITDLLIEEEEIVENELPNLIEEYKKN